MPENHGGGRMAIPDNLAERFAQFGEMSTITADLHTLIEHINVQNKTAGGRDDAYAKEYHKFVEEHGKGLSTGLDAFSDLLERFGASGKGAADGLNDAETDADRIAKGLHG
ncbi:MULTISPECIES: hypothetical protein [unclassified Streptomyces]|uniref:WXG100 family type VII secretion target n=1 Tax=Streptomyces sp. NBC_00060 TaxID=2975636 RepID=A0AAU2H9R9_9ACTN